MRDNNHTITLTSPTSTSLLGIMNEQTYIIVNDKIIGNKKYNATYLTLFITESSNSLLEALVEIKMFFLLININEKP